MPSCPVQGCGAREHAAPGTQSVISLSIVSSMFAWRCGTAGLSSLSHGGICGLPWIGNSAVHSAPAVKPRVCPPRWRGVLRSELVGDMGSDLRRSAHEIASASSAPPPSPAFCPGMARGLMRLGGENLRGLCVAPRPARGRCLAGVGFKPGLEVVDVLADGVKDHSRWRVDLCRLRFS